LSDQMKSEAELKSMIVAEGGLATIVDDDGRG
jgi:hypothetical protein